jgi:hypothetical protein
VQVVWCSADDEWGDFVLLAVADGWCKLARVEEDEDLPPPRPILAPLASIELIEVVE